MIDCYQFINPEINYNVTRTTASLNPYKVNALGKLTDYTDSTFNVIDEITNITSSETITLNTKDLSDDESTWLSGILSSPQVFIQLKDGYPYIPVQVTDTTINLKKRRYLNSLNVKQLTIKLSDGFSPDFKILSTSMTVPNITSAGGDFYVRNA